MRKPSEVLTSIEVDALIEALFYRIQPDARRAIMASLPVAYVKLFERRGKSETSEAVLAEVAAALRDIRNENDR